MATVSGLITFRLTPATSAMESVLRDQDLQHVTEVRETVSNLAENRGFAKSFDRVGDANSVEKRRSTN